MKMRDIVSGPRFADGEYEVTIKHVTHEVSGDKPCLQFEAVNPEGKSIKWRRFLTPAALWVLGGDLVALGLVDGDADVPDDIDERIRFMADLAKETEGQRVTIVVTTKDNPKTGKKNYDVNIKEGEPVTAGDAFARI
jgi:hypothetical protein